MAESSSSSPWRDPVAHRKKVARREIRVPPEETHRIVDLVRSDTPRGFEVYYMLLMGRRLPPHARRWINTAYAARAAGMGTLIRAFRGSTKTTTLTNAFLSYRWLLNPERPNLLIQESDDMADDNTLVVSQIMQHAPVVSLAFPNIKPDSRWGKGGYDIIRSDMPRHAWLSSRRIWGKDPGLLGRGCYSGEVLGKHPAGCLVGDDINNRKNTSSHTELAKVNEYIRETIYPTLEPNDPWEIWVGTPWTLNDGLAYVESTGQVMVCSTPVLEFVTSDTPGALWYPQLQAWVLLAWPDGFGLEKIEKARRRSGVMGFARQYLLDLAAAAGKELKLEWLHEYDHTRISESWPAVIGVDYASTADKLKSRDRDYFSVSVGRLVPGGGIVLVGGYRDKISQGEAEDKIKSIAAMYGDRLVAVGVDIGGKGEEYFNRLVMTTQLPLIPVRHKNINKGERFQRMMAPHFQMGRVWVSDEPSEYLGDFRYEWAGWQAGAPHDDTLDATWGMLVAGQDHLAMSIAPESADGEAEVWGASEANPFLSLGITQGTPQAVIGAFHA